MSDCKTLQPVEEQEKYNMIRTGGLQLLWDRATVMTEEMTDWLRFSWTL